MPTLRGWRPGTGDKSGAGSKEPLVTEAGREQELRQEGSEPPRHDQAPQHGSPTLQQPWENRKLEL